MYIILFITNEFDISIYIQLKGIYTYEFDPKSPRMNSAREKLMGGLNICISQFSRRTCAKNQLISKNFVGKLTCFYCPLAWLSVFHQTINQGPFIISVTRRRMAVVLVRSQQCSGACINAQEKLEIYYLNTFKIFIYFFDALW